MTKDTESLLNEIAQADDISQYISENSDEMLDVDPRDCLERLLRERGLTVGAIASKSSHKDYIYKVFSGSRPPRRDILVCIALGMGLSIAETQQLLRAAGAARLDPRTRRDAAAIYAISHGLTESELCEMLYDIGEREF